MSEFIQLLATLLFGAAGGMCLFIIGYAIICFYEERHNNGN